MNMPTTNLLAMPLAQVELLTGTNENWVDSLLFLFDDGSIDDADKPQLDIRGIRFEMEVRRAAPDHEVIISGSTDDGKLAIGPSPDYGYLLINVTEDEMKLQQPGEYVADIVGTDDFSARRVASLDLTIIQGITR